MDSKQQLALRGGKAAPVSSERSSLGSASFRVYYSLRAGAVPFLWESAPGTPKCGAAVSRLEDPSSLPVETAADAGAATTATQLLLPPISPPPPPYSYQSSKRRRRRASWTAGGIVRALLGVLGLRKSRRRPASELSSSRL